MTSLASVAVVLGVFAMGDAIAAECRDEVPAQQCFIARARIRIMASGLNEVWPIGSKRLYYVMLRSDEMEKRHLPANLRAVLTSDNTVFGELEICPLEPDRPGYMRAVCIQSASDLVVREPTASRSR